MPKSTRKYIAWIHIKGGIDRYGWKTFRTRREALRDAARIIEEVRNDPTVEWRNEIETYGTAEYSRFWGSIH